MQPGQDSAREIAEHLISEDGIDTRHLDGTGGGYLALELEDALRVLEQRGWTFTPPPRAER